MANSEFDISELFDFCEKLATCPREAEKFKTRAVRDMGSKLARKTKAKARASIQKKTGTYLRRIKRGKLVKEGETVRIRVYSNAPHAHLIESGHTKVLWGERTGGRVQGFQVFIEAAEGFEEEFAAEAAKIADRILAKL